MQIECFGIVSDCHNFTGLGTGFTHISQQIPYRIIPKSLLPLFASFTIYTNVFHNFAPRLKFIQAHEVRYMSFCCVRIPLILGGLKIIKYIEFTVRVTRQNVLERSYKLETAYISFQVTDFTISLITFMVSARHDDPTSSTTMSPLTNGFLMIGSLWFAKQAFQLKYVLHSEQGILTAVKAHGVRHTIVKRLVTYVRNVSPTHFLTCFIYVLLRHHARYIHDHVIVSFDIVIE